MNFILLYPTLRCNLKCSYCIHEVDKDKIGKRWGSKDSELNADAFCALLDRIGKPYHLELTGGEPTLYKGLNKVLNKVHDGCTWAITSNTRTDIENIDLQKCIMWTASYHGESEKFDTNLEFLRGKVNLSITVVAEFHNIEDAIETAIRYKMRGYSVSLQRQIHPDVNWRGSEQWTMLQAARGLGINVVDEGAPANYNFQSGFMCRGGSSYFTVMPSGNVYRCFTDAMDGKAIGTVEAFVPWFGSRGCQRECYECAQDVRAREYKL